MVCITNLKIGQEYGCAADLNLYKTPDCTSLVTQARAGRPLKVLSNLDDVKQSALRVCLCDDDYPGWLPITSTDRLTSTASPYRPINASAADIAAQMHRVVDFAKAAMQQPNTYLWGGTVGPNFDCSGLVQTAFAAIGVVLPRDSYQQEQFVTPVHLEQLKLGDLLFFGQGDRTTHVALYLENGDYIHSSGKEHGRNGIGIDSIHHLEDPVSQTYFQQLKGAGRVTQSYQSIGQPMTCR